MFCAIFTKVMPKVCVTFYLRIIRKLLTFTSVYGILIHKGNVCSHKTKGRKDMKMIKFKTSKGTHYVSFGDEVLEFGELREAWKFIFIVAGKQETARYADFERSEDE